MPPQIIPISEPTGLHKYIRDNFYGSGVNSWSKPPAQNQDFFDKLDNLFPGFDVLRRRWGYASFANPNFDTHLLNVYQNNSTGARKIVASSPTAVNVYNEDGTSYVTGLFTVPGSVAPRMVVSRSFGYFVTGTATQYKWNGATSGGISKWGIDPPATAIGLAAPTGIGGFSVQPSVARTGTAGSNSYTYFVIPKNANGSGAFASVSTTTSYSVLSTSNYNTISWGAVPGATSYDVIRVYGANANAPTGTGNYLVGNTTSLSINDQSNTLTSFTVPTPGGAGGGTITLQIGRNYFCVYRNSVTGHYSDLNPVSPSTGVLTNQNQPLFNIPVSADSQVDRKCILATADGGDQTRLFLVADVANATTSYTDTTAEEDLLLKPVYYEMDDSGAEYGCVGNAPPPQGTVPIKHKGRLVMLSGQMLCVSKALDEVTTSTGNIVGNYEECWPVEWQIDISQGAETPNSLLSDGQIIYIGTERTIRRIAGDSPLNFTRPEMVFDETGVLNQECWKRLFAEGQPVGCAWMTPDFRIIQSDFNSYVDIGAPIQDLLSSINKAVAKNTVCSMCVSDGEYDLYMLAIPTGSNTENNVICVYNLRTKTWAVWYPTDNVTAMLYNITATGAPQTLFSSNGTYKYIWQMGRAYTQDRVSVAAANFTATARTVWLNLGDPISRKVLNEIEVLTEDTGLTMSVEMGSTTQDFNSPQSVVSNSAIVQSPFGEYKLYLAAVPTRERYYRLTFTSTGTAFVVLGGYSVEMCYLHQL